MKAPQVDQDAGAEVLAWEMKVDSGLSQTVLRNCIRIKIFTQQGAESQSKVELPYLGSDDIDDVAGRTIKPDGTILELKKDAIFEQNIVHARKFKMIPASFFPPSESM